MSNRTFSFSFALLALVTIFAAESAFASGSWVEQTWGPSYYGVEPEPTQEARPVRQSVSRPKRGKPANLSPFARDTNNLSLGIGQVIPMGAMSAYDASLGVRLNYSYGVSELFAFDSSFGYSNHSEGKYSMTSLASGVRMNLKALDHLIPYLGTGIGFYKPSREVGPNASLSQILFGVYGTAGIDLQLSREIFFGAALSFNNAFGTTKQTSIGPVELGGSYTDFTAKAGYTF